MGTLRGMGHRRSEGEGTPAARHDLDLDPSHEFLHLLHGLLRDIRREVSGDLSDRIAPGQVRLLRVLHRAGRPQRLGELAARLDVAPRSVTTKVDQAERDGWVRRIPDPDDRRATLVTLTDAGSGMLADMAGSRHEGARARLEILTEPERAELLRLLRRVARD